MVHEPWPERNGSPAAAAITRTSRAPSPERCSGRKRAQLAAVSLPPCGVALRYATISPSPPSSAAENVPGSVIIARQLGGYASAAVPDGRRAILQVRGGAAGTSHEKAGGGCERWGAERTPAGLDALPASTPAQPRRMSASASNVASSSASVGLTRRRRSLEALIGAPPSPPLPSDEFITGSHRRRWDRRCCQSRGLRRRAVGCRRWRGEAPSDGRGDGRGYVTCASWQPPGGRLRGSPAAALRAMRTTCGSSEETYLFILSELAIGVAEGAAAPFGALSVRAECACSY